MANEIISVIVPVYQVEKYLNKCVDSILGQTYRNLEIILVDDGSMDSGGRICDEYALRDSRVRVIHKKNGGLSDARNAGISAATGDYIGFVDSDDYIDSRMYGFLLQRMREEQSDLVICNYLNVTEQGQEIEEKNQAMPKEDECLSGRKFLEKLGRYNSVYYVIACNKLYKADLFNGLRFPEAKVHEDEFIAHHLLHKCRRVSFVAQPFYYYVRRGDSITGRKFSLCRLDGVEAYFDRMDFALENDLMDVAAFSGRRALALLTDGYLSLDRGTEEVEGRLRKLRRLARQLYPGFLFSGTDIRSKVIYTLFVLNIRCYIAGRKMFGCVEGDKRFRAQ